MDEKQNQAQVADENVACDACGRYGAYDFCGTHLCVDCYGTRGACCPEFGAEDLTEDEPKTENRDDPHPTEPVSQQDADVKQESSG